ncbi:MAG TPA: AI-2E family transporter [Solirubrobacteraceae bacterium]|nr:AI-2E family transporter [Solirubrobacteraceae bacterium]
MSESENNDELLPEAPPEAKEAERPERPRPGPVVVPRWVQMVAVLLGGLALFAVAKAAGVVLLLFITAAVIALILNPLVAAVQRGRVPRGLAILVVYAGFFLTLAAAGMLLANPIADQFSSFRADVPSIVDSANESLADVQAYFDDKGIDVEVKRQGESALTTLQDRVVGGAGEVVSFGTDLVERLITAGFGVILVFVLSIYMLIYGQRIGDLARSVMPPGDGTRQDDFPTRVVRAVAGYVRGQLLFSLAMGFGAGVGLYLFGVLGIFPDGKTYALGFGAFFGLMELIPYLGPFLGAAPPVIVALFQDPLTAVWVALLFVALQQIEGHIVAPTVFGHALRINPLLVIFALLFGGELYGIIGALVALPTAAVLRETVVYLRQHTVLEPWGTASPLAVAGLEDLPPRRRACPECGAAARADDAFCRRCGGELYEREPARGAHGR